LDRAALRPPEEWEGRPGMAIRRSRHQFEYDPFAAPD
jgi:hypothetical protein